jgi:hypothetical protein
MGDPTAEKPQPKTEPQTPGQDSSAQDQAPVVETPGPDKPKPKDKEKPKPKPSDAPKKPSPQSKDNEDKTSYADKWMKAFSEMHGAINKAMDELYGAMGDKAKKAFNESGPGKKINAALDEFSQELDGLKKRVGDAVGGAVGKVTKPIGELADKAVNKLADGVAAAIGAGANLLKAKEKSDEPDKEKGKEKGKENDGEESGLVDKVKAVVKAVKDFVSSPSLAMGSGKSTEKPESEMELQEFEGGKPKATTDGPKPGKDLTDEDDHTKSFN